MTRATLVESDWEFVRLHEQDRVLLWRAETLERAGYSEDAVARIALDPAADLHLAADLLANGCDEHLALTILL